MAFLAPQWDSNTAVDKTCEALFYKKQNIKRKIRSAPFEKHRSLNKEITSKNVHTIKSRKEFKKKSIVKQKHNKANKLQQTSGKTIPTEHTLEKKRNKKENAEYSKVHENIDLPSTTKKLKNIKKQNARSIKNVSRRDVYQSKQDVFARSRKQRSTMSLRERMLEKLKGARFRYINEQMYTKAGHDSKKYFEQNPNDYKAYHDGYRHQVSRWPMNPLDSIIGIVHKMPKDYIIADFGCGDAKLAKSVPHTVHSFDLVAIDDSVVACDMCKVPLKNKSVDVVVFCLSLMGTNLKEYLREAARVLKPAGMMKIAEVESRFDNIDNFIKDVQKFGFSIAQKDLSHELFWFLDFIKKDSAKIGHNKLPDVHLNPCLYKRR